MLSNLRKPGQAYHRLYSGKELLVKVSGAELAGPGFGKLVDDISALNRDDVRIILAYGGGEQIDARWKERHAEPRPKKHGMGITTPEVLHDAVLPAAADIRKQLEDAFRHMRVLDPADIDCERLEDYGDVGDVQSIALGKPRPLTGVGFVGSAHGKEVNVNADDVALQLVRQYQNRIHEVFFLTKTGGILDRNKNVVSLMNEDGVDQMIGGKHPRVEVTGGMRKKMLVLRKMLPLAGKIAITKTEEFLREIEEVKGSGTLVFHTSSLEHSQLRLKMENEIFEAMFKTYVDEGKFRPRTPQELKELKKHHYVLRAKGSPIGGFTLHPQQDGWFELSALWSGYIGNGVGEYLLQAAKEQARTMGRAESDTNIFSLSMDKDLIGLFRRMEFEYKGCIENVQQKDDFPLPNYVRNYKIPGRNPHVFIYRETIEPSPE